MVEYFKQAGEKARQVVRNGIQEQLEKASLGGAQRGDEGVEISPAKSEAMAGLISRMEIFPVAATDYRDLSMRDEEVSTTLKRLEDTNIPQLKQYLKNFSGQLRLDREQQLLSAAVGLQERVTLALKVQQESWAGRAMERGVAQRLGEKLRVFLEPLRADFHRRQGQMREILESGIPAEIAALVETAASRSTRDLQSYLNSTLAGAHWATLRAAVRRDGRFSGATNIDLPMEMATRFEAPIAELWGPKILSRVQRELKLYAEWCADTVQQIGSWAQAEGADVNISLISAQVDAIKADAKHLSAVGASKMKELRDDVKAHLHQAIHGPIAEACSRFVRARSDIGPGVKLRILSLFSVLACEVTDSAKPAADARLRKAFMKVRTEIEAALKSTADPISRAAEAIIESEESRIRRQDDDRRQEVLQRLERALVSTDNGGPRPRQPVLS